MFVASVVITVNHQTLMISPSNVSANYFFEKNQLFSEKLKTLTGPKFSATEKYKFVMGRRSLTNIHSHAEVVLSKKKPSLKIVFGGVEGSPRSAAEFR